MKALRALLAIVGVVFLVMFLSFNATTEGHPDHPDREVTVGLVSPWLRWERREGASSFEVNYFCWSGLFGAAAFACFVAAAKLK